MVAEGIRVIRDAAREAAALRCVAHSTATRRCNAALDCLPLVWRYVRSDSARVCVCAVNVLTVSTTSFVPRGNSSGAV